MWKRSWILAAAWLCLGGLDCVRSAAADTRFAIQHFGADEGLLQSSVISMTLARDGYLWLGTQNGLVRFDGNHFTTFDDNNTPGLKSSRIFHLFEDSQNGLWIGTDTTGIELVKNGRLLQVPPETNFLAGRLRSTCEDSSGAVWLYTADGQLIRYRRGEVIIGNSRAEKLNSGGTIIAEKSGPLWIGTDFGLFTSGSNADFAPTNVPFVAVPSVTNVNFLLASGRGGFWCLADGHVQRWNDNKPVRDLGPFPWNQSRPPVTSACEDNEGNLVVGTYGGGVYWFDAQGGSAHINIGKGLSSDAVFCVVIDRDDTLWVGTDGGGLNRIKRSLFEVQSEGRTVQSVCEDKEGGLWIGYNGGGPAGAVDYLKAGVRGQFGAGPHGTDPLCYVKSVFVDNKQQIWAGVSGSWDQLKLQGGGLVSIQSNIDRVIFSGLPVSAIYQDRRGLLWVGFAGGLFSWDGRAWKVLTTQNGLPADGVRAIADDAESNLWIGTENGGVIRLRDGKFVSFLTKDGLPSAHIASLYVDAQGVLWAGTGGGLARFKGGKWTKYTSQDGLAYDSVGYLVEDNQGYLWMGSIAGLMRVAKKNLNDFADGLTNYVPCRVFGKSDGLPTSECTFGSQPAACRARDGKLWLPMINGLVSVDPSAIKPNTNPPPVVIESVMIEGVPQGVGGLLAEPLTNVTIPAGREHLEIQYTSLNLAASAGSRFRYRMAGFETGWSPVTSYRVATYPKLPPGAYQFQVTACNEDGIWNETPASLAFTVLPPFWRTWWFLASAALCLLGIIVGAVHYISTQKLQRQLAGFRQQQALENERARIARDIHDQLGASLTQVSLLGEMVESDKDAPAEVEAHARQISQTARDTSRALDEIVWTVNPSNDTLEGLVNYLCKYAQEYLAVAGLRFRLDVPAQLPPVAITPELRHNVFLAAKESITNIVRHARATSAFIRLRIEPSSFTLEIQDDGRGIANLEEKKAGSRNGLRNMGKRMEDVGGRFDISAAPEGGTLVRLTVPIKQP